MMQILLFIVATFAAISAIDGTNILMLSGVPSPSHFIFNKALVEGLAARGHNLTVVSPDVDKKVRQNIHYIHLETVYAHYYNGSDQLDLIELSKESTLQAVVSFYKFGSYMCEGIAKSKGIDVIKNYPNDFKFDLVLHDFTCGPCLLGLLPKFKFPPVIGVSAFNNPTYTADIVGGDKLGLTAKPFYSLSYDIHMNLFQRVHNGIIHCLDSFYRKYFAIPAMDPVIKGLFGSDSPDASDLEKMHDLMLVNSNPAVDYADAVPPNVIQVGGMQIQEPKPLPKEVEEFLNKGKKGAVLMGLGTNVRSDEIGEDKIKMVLETFRQIPDYNFLWKFETSEMISNLPPNVKILDWLPQNDILAHPKVKLFISHAGLLSSHEALWWGVPIVGIPFFADQHRNLHKAVLSGTALKVDFHTFTTKDFKSAIIEVLTNPKYKANTQAKSKAFRDQPEKPIDRAIWWSEYVLRNPKPKHLRPAEFNFGLLGSHFWDIQLLLLVAILLFVSLLKRLAKKVFHSKPKNNSNRTKKHN